MDTLVDPCVAVFLILMLVGQTQARRRGLRFLCHDIQDGSEASVVRVLCGKPRSHLPVSPHSSAPV